MTEYYSRSWYHLESKVVDGIRWHKIICFDSFQDWVRSSDKTFWKEEPFENDIMWIHERLYGFILIKGI